MIVTVTLNAARVRHQQGYDVLATGVAGAGTGVEISAGLDAAAVAMPRAGEVDPYTLARARARVMVTEPEEIDAAVIHR